MCMTESFKAMVNEAVRLYMPTSYDRDLYYHDRNYLEEHDPPVFGWMLRDMGTHLFDPRYDKAIDLLYAAVKTWPDGRLYWWNGTELLPMTYLEVRSLLYKTQRIVR